MPTPNFQLKSLLISHSLGGGASLEALGGGASWEGPQGRGLGRGASGWGGGGCCFFSCWDLF